MMKGKEQFLLMKLAEECAEVAQRALKQIQFGRDQIQKGTEVKDGVAPPDKEAGLSNGQRLRGEIMDLLIFVKWLEAIGAFETTGVIDMTDEFSNLMHNKIAKVRKYANYSVELGQLREEVLS